MKVLLRILLRFLLSIALVWALATYLDAYFFVTGGWKAFVIIAALLTLMNLLVRPILDLIVAPLRLLANLLAMILVNGIFLWLIVWIVDQMNPALVTLDIQGGIGGWIVVMLALGVAKWVMKLLIR